jgi:hypothetical protein
MPIDQLFRPLVRAGERVCGMLALPGDLGQELGVMGESADVMVVNRRRCPVEIMRSVEVPEYAEIDRYPA